MIFNRKCPVCEFEFQARAANAKYCSDKCKRRSHYLAHRPSILEKNRAWAAANPELMAEYNRAYRRRRARGLRNLKLAIQMNRGDFLAGLEE